MKQTILSKVSDGKPLKLNKRSKVTYTRIKKVKKADRKTVIVIQSNNSPLSFEKSGKTKVWINAINKK